MFKNCSFILIAIFCTHLFAFERKGQFHYSPDIQNYDVILRFDATKLPQFENGKVRWGASLPSLQNLARAQLEKQFSIKYKALFKRAESLAEPLATDLNSENPLSGMVVLSHSVSHQNLPQLCALLEQLPEVLYCDLVPKGVGMEKINPPQILTFKSIQPPQSSASDWTSYQKYLNAAPAGIDAKWAWSEGIMGQGIVAHDAEWAWIRDHEDLDFSKIKSSILEPDTSYQSHGTAVLGEIMASNNTYGMTGAAYGLDSIRLYSERDPLLGRTGAIAAAIEEGNAGEVLILEMQTGGCITTTSGTYTPADYNQSVWDLVNQATQKGLIVVAAAGNGAQNLDHSCYQNYRDRGDNGAIIVGAGTGESRGVEYFSTYGSRVNLQGWGEGVYSLSYGSLFNGGSVQTQYTSGFNGTSSATPIVASAAILVQSWLKKYTGKVLNSKEMRNLLIATGTPQATDAKQIGPLPNVRAAIESLAVLYTNGNVHPSSDIKKALFVEKNTSYKISTWGVELRAQHQEQRSWEILDVTGHLIERGDIPRQQGDVFIAWKKQLRSGVYFFKLGHSSGINECHKFIIP